MKADLHIHSTCSDGTNTPEEILYLAKEKGLFALSITDHDTIAAYTPDFFSKAKELELDILVGVELSCQIGKENVHILAYNFDLKDESFKTFIQEIQEGREERNKRILQKLKGLGIDIDPHFLEKKVLIGRPHIAQVLIEQNIVRDMKEGFDVYLKEGGKAYVSGTKPILARAIEMVHQAKGLALIAHPHILKKRVLKKLLDLPFDGLECYYGNFPYYIEKPFYEIAQKKKWLISGGSDFHGAIKPHNPLGCSWVNEENYRKLKV